MSANLKGVKLAEANGKALAKAADLLNKYQRDAKAAAEKVASTKELLKRAGWLDDASVKLADEHLNDHAKALDVICNIAEQQIKASEKSAQQTNAELGAPAGDNGSSDGLTLRAKRASAITGFRRGDDDPVDLATQSIIDRFQLPIGSR